MVSIVSMVSAIGTLIVDTVATGYFQRTDAKRKAAAIADEPDDLQTSDEHSHGPRPWHALQNKADKKNATKIVVFIFLIDFALRVLVRGGA
ncbi:hypothetical protein OsI_02535 [Oryza sativa Indica Group]|uniref:Uncharacterized protein n=1 Tax=Oryza sativa subsp. indica TaxID=39946 RepID=B8AAP6_ORYSI|nr:hypothetical protein OsI_02535 [Oryza sativa Indica Group]